MWRELDFLEKVFMPQKLGECNKSRPKIGFFKFKQKFGHCKFVLFTVFPHKSYTSEKPCSGDIGWSTLSQSDCRIFKSSIFTEQIIKTASFFAWYFFQKLSENVLDGHGQNMGVANLLSGL